VLAFFWERGIVGGMRTYLFVDAESHFRRSLVIAEKIIGSPRGIEALIALDYKHYHQSAFPRHIDGKRFGFAPDLQLFWDCTIHTLFDSRNHGQPDRAIYVCSCTGGDDDIHKMRTGLRAIGFEPIVVQESKDHFKQRAADLANHNLIEKPKGCDIAIATRMVADAAADLFDSCCLFTSDADFLPAIEAVRRMGKQVVVAAYKSALGSRP
jgi:hypothetical protein